jgi:hypothetical protein
MIPTAMTAKRSRAKRTRDWEKLPEHRVRGYRVPQPLRALVGEKDGDTGLRHDIREVADEHTSTVSEVARNLMDFALSEVRAGRLQFEARAKPQGRTMRLEWSLREFTWPRETPAPKKRNKKKESTAFLESQSIFLAYRWGKDMDQQIKQLALKVGVTSGEIVVYLLQHAIQAYNEGHLQLRGTPEIVRQKLTSSW